MDVSTEEHDFSELLEVLEKQEIEVSMYCNIYAVKQMNLFIIYFLFHFLNIDGIALTVYCIVLFFMITLMLGGLFLFKDDS